MSTVRLFESEHQAEGAAARLVEAGFRQQTISVISPAAGQEEAAVQSAVASGALPGSHRRVCVDALRRGRHIVTIEAPFGHEQEAIDILTAGGAVETDSLPAYSLYDPTPLSDFLGIPVLSSSRTTTQLAQRRFTFPSWLGLGLTSKKAAPLSSMIGLKPLSQPKRPRTSSFGLPLLTKSGGPTFGFKAIISPKRGWSRSFGLPLLSKNSAPLSSMFGIPLLTRRDREGD